ncbi:MAG: LLM class flavin-dependent oxidoreductase [Candidatus Ranarchaeia archaeon]
MNEHVWFGYHLPPEGLNFTQMKNACLAAESAGLDLFTVTDHLMNMADPHGKEGHPLECWVLLGALSAVTKKIRLGPLVSCYGYRTPTLLAKMATTVDVISNGRLVMGIGAGWHETEFKGFYGRFPSISERIQGYSDALAIVYSMFKNRYTTYKGKVFSAENTLNSPPPVQEHVPMMVGAFGKRTIRIATKYADIIHCLFEPTPERVRLQKKKIIDGCEKTGRNPEEIRMGAGYRIWLNPSPNEIGQRIATMIRQQKFSVNEAKKMLEKMPVTPNEHVEEIRSLIDNGVKVFTFSGPISKIAVFAKEVLAHIR